MSAKSSFCWEYVIELHYRIATPKQNDRKLEVLKLDLVAIPTISQFYFLIRFTTWLRFSNTKFSCYQSILGEFNKEQEAFIREKEGKGNGTAVPPWSGCPNEASLKEQCLALSTVRIRFIYLLVYSYVVSSR